MLPILQRIKYPILSIEANNPELSGDLHDRMFELHNPQTMWYVKNPIIAAPDRASALELLNKFYNIELPEEKTL